MGFSLGSIGKIAGSVGKLAGGVGNMAGVFGDSVIRNAGNYFSAGDWHDQYSAQKEFARHGIRWKVEDAKNAGIHPLYAIGAPATSFSPVSVGGPGDKLSAMANMGQSIYGALSSGMSADEKELQLIKLAQEKEKLKQMGLETQGMEKQLADVNRTPAVEYGNAIDKTFGIVGQGKGTVRAYNPETGQDIPVTGYKFKEKDIPYSQSMGIEAGIAPLERHVVDLDGNLHRVPSSEMEETMESDAFTQLKYAAMRGSRWAQNLYGYFNAGYGAREYHKWLYDNKPASPDEEHEYRYDPYWDTWKLVRKLGSDQSYLYHSPGGESERYNYTPGYYRD